MIILCLVKGKEESFKEKNSMFMSFYQYFEDVSLGTIITKHILNFILTCILNFLRVLTNLHLTPDYILISFSISRIINIVIETKRYECLALFPFQFIFLMFYLEIFELTFCGLNKNTKTHIQKRVDKEMFRIESIDINRIDSLASNNSEIELDNYTVSCDDDDDKNEAEFILT